MRYLLNMQGIVPRKRTQRTTPMLQSLASFDGAITRPVWNELVEKARKAGLTRVDYKHHGDLNGDASGVARLLGITNSTANQWRKRCDGPRPVYFKSNMRKVYRALNAASAKPKCNSHSGNYHFNNFYPFDVEKAVREALKGVYTPPGKVTVKIGKITIKIGKINA
jgi:hypothetical protein